MNTQTPEHKNPPRLPWWLLQCILKKELAEEVNGDLEANFIKISKNKSTLRAQLNYYYQVLHYIRPFAMKNMKSSSSHFILYRHNLLLTIRNFKKHKSSFFINLIGLSTGLASALLIYLWVMDEVNFDKFHEKKSQIYQVMERRVFPDATYISDETSGVMAEELKITMPEVDYAAAEAPSSWFNKFTLSLAQKNVKAIGQYVGRDYFNIFSFNLLDGTKDQVLADKNSIVISQALAIRLFNTTENLIGKPIMFQHEREFLVSGVFENIPTNSSEQFEFLLSFEYYKDVQPWVKLWTSNGPHSFLVLKKGTDINEFDKKIADVIKRNSETKYRTAFVLPFSDNYLLHTFDHGELTGRRITYVKLFSIVALFILSIACINFMNLSTAKASRRIKEVGIKKAIGAGRKQLIVQYLSESMLLTVLSVLLALMLVLVLLPKFNELTGKSISLHFDKNLILSLLGITLFTGLLSGSYPALYLSGFDPAAVLKGKLNTSFGELWARKGLVVFQFTLSVILIVAVLVVYKQIEYIQTSNLGYNKENIIRFESEGKVLGTQETFLAGLKQIPGVINASGTFHNIVGRNYATSNIYWEGKDRKQIIFFEGVQGGYDLLQTLGMQIVEGRNYTRESGDSSGIIVNEAAVKVMGMKDPIGKTIRLYDQPRQIIGVMKDFHFQSLHTAVGPVYYDISTAGANTWYKILVKIEAGKERETIARIEDYYKIYNPGFILDYAFLDEAFQKQYASETRVAKLSRYFAIIAILISCLGLFGLTAFTAERRTKEIGIRKVLGSSNFNIVYILSADFTKIILVSIVIALPISYFMTKTWLDSFAYRIDLKVWFFVGAGLITLLIGWVTVGIQIVKASMISPVQCLKTE